MHVQCTLYLPAPNFLQGFWHFYGNICSGKKIEKNALHLSVSVFSMKVLIRDNILQLLLETGLPFYLVV